MSREILLQSVAAKLRGGNFQLLTALNEKTPKGEKLGYLSKILYLAPHTVAGGKSVCPHSTEACRAACLFSAGRGKTPRVFNARVRRTRFFLEDRDRFLDELIGELVETDRIAKAHGLKLAIRLNGTSDIGWEREPLDGKTLFELFPEATFYDYTRWPTVHRHVPENWRLVWSMADEPPAVAAAMLAAGRSVSAVVPGGWSPAYPEWFALGDRTVPVVDGDEHDLRFLDPPGALVLLRPKGAKWIEQRSPMVHRNLIPRIREAHKETAT